MNAYANDFANEYGTENRDAIREEAADLNSDVFAGNDMNGDLTVVAAEPMEDELEAAVAGNESIGYAMAERAVEQLVFMARGAVTLAGARAAVAAEIRANAQASIETFRQWANECVARKAAERNAAEAEAEQRAENMADGQPPASREAAQPFKAEPKLAGKPGRQCDKCNGKGIWYGRGYVENGVFKGKTGKCYACGGKGVQTPADVRRNNGYWRHNGGAAARWA